MEGDRLDNYDIQELASGYRERVRRLALFDPLYELDRKREMDQDNQLVDMKGLGLLALLFFFEQKLMRQYKSGVKQLSAFLQQLTQSKYRLEEEGYEKIARLIIYTFRPTTGKKRGYAFFNWEERIEDLIEYSILKANDFDVTTNTQYYTLDEDGLELVFATKEFYSEFQLSINQLLLRKQLDKGEFKGALRQINEMGIDVESLEERMIKLKHEIQRSIVSEETFERYKQLLEDIYGRLTREDEEFKELREFVKETRERLYSKDTHQKEQKTYELLLKITRELERVHYDHSRLLEQTIGLKNTTLVTAQESLYYTGIQAFNFDHDLVSRIISTPLPLDAMKGVLHPFLRVEENKMWSPLSVFAEQNITEDREEKVEQSFIEVEKGEFDDPYFKWITEKYKLIMEQYLLAAKSGEGDTLSKFLSFLEVSNQEELFQERYFYEFWLFLHQRSPVTKGEFSDDDRKTVFTKALALLGERTLSIQERNQIIKRYERFSIQEMDITLEGDEHELF